MAGEKKARKMGAAEKVNHKEKTRDCPQCGQDMKWVRWGSGGMKFWCRCGAVCDG